MSRHPLADQYFGLLKNLEPAVKLELISMLSQSVLEIQAHSVPLSSLFGAYETEESAEDIIAQLRNARVFTRNTEAL